MSAAPVFPLFPDGVAPDEEQRNATEVFPAPSDPLAVTRILLEENTAEDQVLIRRWREGWWQHAGPHWTEVEELAVRKWVYTRLEHVQYEKYNPKTEQVEMKPWCPSKGSVSNVLDALASVTVLDARTDAPRWLDTDESAAGWIACANGLVSVDTQELRPCTPRYFGTSSVPFDYDPDAPEPVAWFKFLRDLWKPVKFTGDEPEDEQKRHNWWKDEAGKWYRDADEVLALRQWFGYVLSGRTDLQKMLLVIGPPRSGKGTIARILTALLGAANVAAPTLASLSTNFGLAPLLGRPLAIVGDARLSGSGQEQVVERLLSISGEDTLGIDRKNRDALQVRLPTRVMILSNELPRFGDQSGAIASRFVILTLVESFLGHEDTGLEKRLRAELPGILRWALGGLVALNDAGRFTEPAASVEAVQQLADLVSPMSAFLRDVCDSSEPESSVEIGALYEEYTAWCEENGRSRSSRQKMASDIRSVLPRVKDYRPKGQPRHLKGITVAAEWTEHRGAQRTAWAGVGWRQSGGEPSTS